MYSVKFKDLKEFEETAVNDQLKAMLNLPP